MAPPSHPVVMNDHDFYSIGSIGTPRVTWGSRILGNLHVGTMSEECNEQLGSAQRNWWYNGNLLEYWRYNWWYIGNMIVVITKATMIST